MTRIRYKAFDYGVPLWTPKCSKCPRMASNVKPFYTTPGKGSGDEEENGERKNKNWERIFMLSFDLKNNGRVPVGFRLRVLSSFSCCKSSDGGILWGEVHLYSYTSRVILRGQSLPSDRCLVRGAALHGTRGNAWNGKRCKTDRLLFLDLELFEETPCKRVTWSGRT